jgi:hypothetical protein
MLTLYDAPGICAFASQLALEYAGAPCEAVRVGVAIAGGVV